MTISNDPITTNEHNAVPATITTKGVKATETSVWSRDLRIEFPCIVGSRGNFLSLNDGREILDASGGAAVACIGHGDTRVHKAMMAQLGQVSYCATTFYTTDAYEVLCSELVKTTKGHMSRAYIVNSGESSLLSMKMMMFISRVPPSADRYSPLDRLRGHGGCHEARQAVLSGEGVPGTQAQQVHREIL